MYPWVYNNFPTSAFKDLGKAAVRYHTQPHSSLLTCPKMKPVVTLFSMKTTWDNLVIIIQVDNTRNYNVSTDTHKQNANILLWERNILINLKFHSIQERFPSKLTTWTKSILILSKWYPPWLWDCFCSPTFCGFKNLEHAERGGHLNGNHNSTAKKSR